MRRIPVLALFVVVAGVLGSLPAAAAKRPITLDDLARLREVEDPQRSPDGAWVAYTVTSIDAEKDTSDSDIWMARWTAPRRSASLPRPTTRAIRAGARTASTWPSSPRAATRRRRRRAIRSGCCIGPAARRSS